MNKLDQSPDFIKLHPVEESTKHGVKQGKGNGLPLDTGSSSRLFQWRQTSDLKEMSGHADAQGEAFQTEVKVCAKPLGQVL